MNKSMRWMEKSIPQRILALALCTCMVLTMSPPLAAAEASDKDSGNVTLLSGFAPLPDEVAVQNVAIGTSSVDLVLPDSLEATAEEASEASRLPALGLSSGDAEQATETVTVEGVTWESDPAFDGDTEGTYSFTAVLPVGYAVEDGVAVPIITVTVGEAEQSAVDKVIAMIDALPSYAELTANPPADADPEYPAWLAKTKKSLDEILAAKKAYDALTDEEKAQIDEARTAKLLELAELAEQMASIMPMAAADFGTDCTWEITADGVLILAPKNGISGTLPAITSTNNQPWNGQKASITSVKVESGVKANVSSSYLFYGLSACTEMELSGLDTTDVADMSSMFAFSKILTSITLGNNFNTEKVTNMSSMFKNCEGLASLDVGKFNTAKVTNMSGMFERCYALPNLAFNNSFTTTAVTNMSKMFYACRGLTTLDLSSFTTTAVTNMSEMFAGCSGLNPLTLGDNFTTAAVANMSGMFTSCNGLMSLDVSNFNTDKVTDMSNMFSGCSGLTSLVVSNFTTTNVKTMGSMFSGCSGLTSLDVSNFKTTNVTTMANMFSGCSGLISLYVSKLDTANVTTMGSMFKGCSGLTTLNLSGLDFTKVTIMSSMFEGCSGLLSLDLSSFTTTAVTNMGSMFKGCSGLTSLNLSSFNTAEVTNMSNMFSSCSSLTSLDLSGFDFTKVTSMGGMFSRSYIGLKINFYKQAISDASTRIYLYDKHSKDDFFADKTDLDGTETNIVYKPYAITKSATSCTITTGSRFPAAFYQDYFIKTADFNPSGTAPTYDGTKDYAQQGETVTITLTPTSGALLDTVTVTKADNSEVTLAGTGNTRIFNMPAGDVTITASFKLDKTLPAVTVGTHAADWTSTAQNISVTYTDDESGIDTAQYAITSANSGTKPTTLTNLPASGGSVSVSTNGTNYIYYKVTDKAGNVTEGYSAAIKVDTTTPTLTVSGGDKGAASLTLAVTSSFGASGGKVTVNGAEITTSYNVNTKGSYNFTATSNAGKTAAVTKTVYGITFDSNGGGAVASQLVVSGGKATVPTNPTKTGFTFGKWQKGGTDYDLATAVTDDTALTAVWTLDAPTVSLAADKANTAYDAGKTVATLTASSSHPANGATYTYEWYRGSIKLNGTGSTLPLTDVADSGSYTVKVTAVAGGLTSAQATSNEVAVSIAKADVQIDTAPTAIGITYGQALSDSALTSGAGSAAGSFAWTDGSITPAVADSATTPYSITFTPTDTANYNTATTKATLTVSKATLTPSVNTVSDKTYDGGTDAVGTIKLDGAVPGENPTASGTFAFTDKNAAINKPVNVTGIALDGTWGDNYALDKAELPNVATTAKITPKETGLNWSGHTALVYSGAPVSVTATATGLVEGDTCTVTVTGGKETNAGTHTATATALANGNYKLPTDVEQAYTIAKAPVTFAVTANEHDYNATAKTATVAQTAGEAPAASGKFTVSYAKDNSPVAMPTNAGVYEVLVTLTDVNFKHKDSEDTVREIKVGTLTINGVKYPQADTMSWPTAANITYGQTLGDSALTGGDQAAKGTYTWTTPDTLPAVQNDGYIVVFTPADTNYSTVEKILPIVVNKATPTLALPTAASIIYGETLADSTLTGGSASTTYNGADKAVPGRYTWTTSTTMPKVSDSSVTEYGLTFTPTDTANYNIVTTGKVKLAVAQKPVSLTWAGHTALVYSGAPVSVTATATGLVGGDSCAVTVTDGGKTDVGTYTAKATAVSNPNYKQPDNAEQAYTITKKPVKVLWSDLFPAYDGTQKYPTLALEGVVNSEDCTAVSTGSAQAGNAGRYKVTAVLQGARSGNYTLQNPGEILVIQPAPVNVTLSDYSYKYDGAAKYATVTATPDVPLTVTYKLAGNEVTDPTGEGIYDILVGLNGKNYRFADGTDGKTRRMGALTIYKEKPPELFTITFKPGAEDTSGTAPALPPSVKDTVHFLPGNPFLRAGHAFVGWKNGNTVYQPGERFIQPANNNTVFTAQWEAATYDIGGVVDQDGKPLANVRVVLMRGAEQVAETVTNQIGEYRFDSVLPGLYNLVASKPSPDGVGDIIMTIMVEVKASDVEQANITLPSGKTNSIVEVAPGTPKIIVGNLDQMFKNTEGNDFTPEDEEVVNKGGTVEIKFIAQEKQKSEIAGDAEEITKEAGRTKIGLYLSLDVEKTVTQPHDPSTPDVEPPSDTTPVPETGVLLQSVIPLPGDLQGKQSYTVYRVHDGTVGSLTTGTDNGERIEVSEDKTTLTLYAQKFSTYAVAYTEKSSGGGDDDDDSESDRKPDPIKPEQSAPVAPVVPAQGTDVPGTVPNPTPPEATQPGSPGTDGEDTVLNPDGGNNDAQKDDIRDALEDAIKNLPDILTDEQRQTAIDELTRIADAAIAALDGTNDPDEARKIVEQAKADMEQPVAGLQDFSGDSTGKPFVVASALFALAAVLLAVYALLKRKDKRRGLFSAIFAALAVVTFLLTSGRSGFVLADWWTPVVAAFAIGAAMGVLARYSKQEEQPQTK